MIAVIADTHMPKGSRRLPERRVELLSEADAVLHAGDFCAVSVLGELEALCPVVHAVHGNVDDAALRGLLPERRLIELGGHRLGLVHDAGPARGRLARLRRRARVRARLAQGLSTTLIAPSSFFWNIS